MLLGHRVNCFKSKNIGVWGVPRRSAVNTSSSLRAALLRYPRLKENVTPESGGWDQVGMELRFLRSLSPRPLRPEGGSTLLQAGLRAAEDMAGLPRNFLRGSRGRNGRVPFRPSLLAELPRTLLQEGRAYLLKTGVSVKLKLSLRG